MFAWSSSDKFECLSEDVGDDVMLHNSGRGNSTDEDRCPGSDHSGLRSIPARKTPHGHRHVRMS